MKYEIVPNNVAENWFEINETTGQISVKKTIDREDDDVLESNGNFQFQVKVSTSFGECGLCRRQI